MTWADLFDRARRYERTLPEVRDCLAAHRSDD